MNGCYFLFIFCVIRSDLWIVVKKQMIVLLLWCKENAQEWLWMSSLSYAVIEIYNNWIEELNIDIIRLRILEVVN